MDQKIVIGRIDKLLSEYSELRKQSEYDDLSGDYDDGEGGVSEAKREDFTVRAVATIESIAPKDSPYVKNAYTSDGRNVVHVQYLVGILQALKKDIEDGYLWNMNELIHADVFADFLEMARYLLDEGYKDPSAVLIGGVLEEHLRKLCLKNNIKTEITKGGESIFKKTAAMNDDLKGVGAYGNLEHKSIIAWLDLRNKASHGKYREYSKEQVQIMLAGVRDFIAKFPA